MYEIIKLNYSLLCPRFSHTKYLNRNNIKNMLVCVYIIHSIENKFAKYESEVSSILHFLLKNNSNNLFNLNKIIIFNQKKILF